MVTKKESEKISNLEIDVKVIMEKVDTIENNQIWGIVTLAIVQLCAIILTTI